MIALLVWSSTTAGSAAFRAGGSPAAPVSGVRIPELSHASPLNARAMDFAAHFLGHAEIHCQTATILQQSESPAWAAICPRGSRGGSDGNRSNTRQPGG